MDFIYGKAEQTLQCLCQAQVLQFVATGKEERAQRSGGIIMTSLFKCQKDIATHGNGDMTDHAVIVRQLRLPFQVHVVFLHLEEPFYVPSLAVNAHDLFVCQVNTCGQDCKPLTFLLAVPYKNDFNLCPFVVSVTILARILALPRRFLSELYSLLILIHCPS